tara:strand:+ start:1010 stop:2296 length:1287 start_codon:yes stop_codon:yes gene_type:complete
VKYLFIKLNIFYFFIFNTLSAQPYWDFGTKINDSVYTDNFHSCILSPSESMLDFPAVQLNSAAQLLLQFDDFSFVSRDYMYTLTHCNADWTISELNSSEFVNGFAENYIQDYQFSFNTKVSYVHYELLIPNLDIQWTKSGNYILTIYDSEHTDLALMTKRFMVYDNSLSIQAKVQQATLASNRFTDHEIDVIVNFNNINFVNPIQDVHMSIYQGHRWDNVIENLTPSFIEQKRLIYDFEIESSFDGGNEYRFFDTKSVRYYTERVQDIIVDSVDVVLLYPDYPWANQTYGFYPDIEGYYKPNILEKSDPRTDADYVWVNFCLKKNIFIDPGELYIFGGLTNWTLTEDARLNYDSRLGCYETSLLLKQGYYNYTYLFLPEDSQSPSQVHVDGNFYQTSQNYLVFVYLYDYNFGYDRLLGMQMVSTRGMF